MDSKKENQMAKANIAIWAVNHQQKILYWNQAAEKIFNHTAENALGKHCHQVINGRDREGNSFCKKTCNRKETKVPNFSWSSKELYFSNDKDDSKKMSVDVLHIGSKQPEEYNRIHFGKINSHQQYVQDHLSIHLLGQINVIRMDGSFASGTMWNRSKVRSLLAYLTVNMGKLIHREKLIDIFWPDLEYKAALANLNTTIYGLRHCLEPKLQDGSKSNFVMYEQEHYFLDSDAEYWVDFQAFEYTASRAFKETNRNKAISKLKEATSLYKGDFLENIILCNSWAVQEQIRLRDLYFRCQEKLGNLYIAAGHKNLGLNTYTHIFSEDPAKEDVAEKIISIYLEDGNRPMALHYHTLLANALDENFNLTPRRKFTEYF